MAFRALDAGGTLSYDSERSSTDPWGVVEYGKHADKPLSEMVTGDDFAEVRGSGYKNSLLATELLASYAGEEALLRYYNLQGSDTTWQGAFGTALGMAVEEFYERFEEHRAAGFPEVDIQPSPVQ